jgi:hypothetical protein
MKWKEGEEVSKRMRHGRGQKEASRKEGAGEDEEEGNQGRDSPRSRSRDLLLRVQS